jgi:hypothetical protein
VAPDMETVFAYLADSSAGSGNLLADPDEAPGTGVSP